MKKITLKKTFLLFLPIVFFAFHAREEIPFLYPSYFPKPIYNFEKNPLNKEKIALGRELFYDPFLSKNNTISCASCHLPEHSFSNNKHRVGKGIYDSLGFRNAPALFNLAWQKELMWDGSEKFLDYQAFAPINHPKEMGETMTQLVVKLNKNPKYRRLFYRTFGDSVASAEQISKALAQFQLTLVSFNSKYDKVKSGKEKFTENEQKGYEIFVEKCSSCHTEPLFTNNEFSNIGLPPNPKFRDLGKMNITKHKSDSLKFKTPSLRNLSFTFPYMHDGRFQTLEDVLEHYTFGMERSPTLAKELTFPIIFSEKEKQNLLLFLQTLNDSAFVYNKDFRRP